MLEIFIPSAIDMSKCFDVMLDLISFRIDGTTGGLTARIMISELFNTSKL